MGDEEEVVLSRMNNVGIHDGSWRNVLATATLDCINKKCKLNEKKLKITIFL